MEKFKKLNSYSFAEHKFPDAKLIGCNTAEFNPSQADKIYNDDSYIFVFIYEGKGVVSYLDKRFTVTKGNGVVIPKGVTVQLKADSIEPLSIISVIMQGESVKEIVLLAEKKESSYILKFENINRIYECARDLINECSKDVICDYTILLTFYDILSCLYEHYTEKRFSTKNAYMMQAVEYIKQNYNKNISVENISNLLGIERSYLSRLFKTYKNKSTQNYIIDYRMRQARRMFEEEDMNVSQVCTAVGYTNIYCFSRIFKSRVGMPPKEYMERCKKKTI